LQRRQHRTVLLGTLGLRPDHQEIKEYEKQYQRHQTYEVHTSLSAASCLGVCGSDQQVHSSRLLLECRAEAENQILRLAPLLRQKARCILAACRAQVFEREPAGGKGANPRPALKLSARAAPAIRCAAIPPWAQSFSCPHPNPTAVN